MITSPDNDKLKLVRRLARRRDRDREGLFVTEGEDLLEAGLRAGAAPRFVLAPPETQLASESEPVEPALLDGLSSLGSGSRAIAVWEQRPLGEVEGPVCVYLHGVSDPGNVGAIVRSAHALVGGTVVLGEGCADPFGPKAVRASMGSIFAVHLARAAVRATPAPRIAMVTRGGAPPGPRPHPLTLCLGAEREGLPEDLLAACEERWTIPLRGEGADSLNVAAAAAIGLERICSPAGEGGGR